MRTRYAHSHMPVKTVETFQSGEEAWFWFIRCQLIRHEGAQPTGAASAFTRPCDPDDIYRAVVRLHKQKHLTAEHLRTLSLYGLAERPPDARRPEESKANRLWNEAIKCLEARLKDKGIVASHA